MLKRSLSFSLLFCVVLTCSTAFAQNLCPPGVASDKLICLLPQVYGPNGIAFTNSDARFNNFLADSLKPLNSALARQSALLPLVSPSSGITFTEDPASKLPVPSNESFGPIFGERAETIGKYRMFLGFGYEYFNFGTLDGVNLKNFPLVLTQPDVIVDAGPPIKTCSVNSTDPTANTLNCGFIRDVITTDNRLDLKIHQWNTFVTFGLTDRIDISMVIPIENVRMGISANATIVNNSNSNVHLFQNPLCAQPCRNHLFSNVRTASGIGDVTLRVKGTAWKGKRGGLALGADVRLPTGDALNFIGAGAAGIKPFVVWSYQSKISPHVLVGYETNGSSVIAGDISTGAKARLPGQLTYSAGADVWPSKRLTAAIDLVGQQVFEADRTSIGTFTEPAACLARFPTCGTADLATTPKIDANLASLTGTYNITNISVGMKARPFRSEQSLMESKPFSSLLVTGNVLIKINNGGLRTEAIPLVGVSYTF